MATPKRLVVRWSTLKGAAAILLFIIIATVVEYMVVLYAISLGVEDKSLLQWSFKFPGTEWDATLTISSLFHLVPSAVILSLVFSWICLTSYFTIKPAETPKSKDKALTKAKTDQKLKNMRSFFKRIKMGLLRTKGVAYIWQRIHFARTAVKSASILLLTFGALVIVFSLLAYPKLIYHAVSNAYQNNPSLLNFVKGTVQFFAPLTSFFSVINSALIAAAPGFKDFAVSISSVIGPLTRLDDVGKFLVFQNLAAWISAFAILIYGEYRRKAFRQRTFRRK
jgi:hypothetical protein